MDNRVAQLSMRVRVSGTVVFDTAFHIGSGREGLLSTDMGVLLDEYDRPVLPGSTLKGLFRSTAERLAPHLGLSACLLDGSLSGINCVTDENYRKKQKEEFTALISDSDKLAWLAKHTCGVCSLFGSPHQGSRIFFCDGVLTGGGESVQVRDGVCIDRDSGTAVDQEKFDFEVVSKETVFETMIDLENPSPAELALVGAVTAEWEQGFRLGGFTSRGLGRAKLTDISVRQVDYTSPDQLRSYLLEKQMTGVPNLLKDALEKVLSEKGVAHA